MGPFDKLATKSSSLPEKQVKRKLRDQRIALLFESERELLDAGMQVNYHLYGVLLMATISSYRTEIDDAETRCKPLLDGKRLTAYLRAA